MNPFLYLSHILLTFVVFTAPGTTNAFGFSASPANYIYPGKRPQSSISSSIAEDLETGEFKVATGAAGGSRIITATLQSLHFTLDQGLTPNASVHTSRWHDQLTNVTYFELPATANGLPGFNNGTVDFLASLGCAFNLFFCWFSSSPFMQTTLPTRTSPEAHPTLSERSIAPSKLSATHESSLVMGMRIRQAPRHRPGLLTANSHYSYLYGTKMRSHGFGGVNSPCDGVS